MRSFLSSLLAGACAAQQLDIFNLGVYPGHQGSTPTGSASLKFFGKTSVVINYELENVDPACTKPDPNTANSCGIHIHEGTTCDDASLVGGHYFNKDTFASDVWSPVSFVAGNSNSSTIGKVVVDYGFSAVSTLDRALVIHDHSGARVTCALLQVPDSVNVGDLGTYPGYAGPARPVGYANLDFQDNGVLITFNILGLESACSAPNASAPNSCGIHIHAGTSCADASLPGGHYFNKDTIAADPWGSVVYQTLRTSAFGTAYAQFGYPYKATRGRVLVVHDHSGARATCAIIDGGYPNH
jgi:hypothetical protein